MTEEVQASKVKFSKRLGATFLNLLGNVLLVLVFQLLIFSNTYMKAMGYDNLQTNFVTLNEEYEAKQDEYQIYIKDESGNRIFNENVSKENQENFLKDVRVIYLREKIPLIENQMLNIAISSWIFSYLSGTLFGVVVFNFCFGKGRNFGCLLTGIHYEDYMNKKPSISLVIRYSLFKWIELYLLGVLSIFIIPCIELYNLYYHEKSQTLLERWLKIEYKNND